LASLCLQRQPWLSTPGTPSYRACDPVKLLMGWGCVTDLPPPPAAHQAPAKAGTPVALSQCTTYSFQVLIKVGWMSCAGTGGYSSALVVGIGPGIHAGIDNSTEVSVGSSNKVQLYAEGEICVPAGPEIGVEGTGNLGTFSGSVGRGVGIGESPFDAGVQIPSSALSTSPANQAQEAWDIETINGY
jgi:hypothetical protein